jgi:F0F1-type ATP synthase assembly protein I
MNHIVSLGNRLVVHVLVLQMSCAAIVGLLFWIFADAHAALAGVAGGLIAAIGSALFGWRMFAPGIAPASTLRRAMFAGESLKWLWYVAALWAVFAWLKLPPLPVITGVLVAQLGYFGLIAMRTRG